MKPPSNLKADAQWATVEPHAPPRKLAYVATLGTAPQVVTLALDELLRRGLKFREAIILHPSATNPRIQAPLDRLRPEAAHYNGLPFRFVPFRLGDHEPEDVVTKEDAQAVQATLWRELKALKQQGFGVHLSIAGGRKVISSYGTATAQMIFDEHDCCWHLMSEFSLENSQAMHAAPGEKAVLVPVPIARWSSLPPAALALALTDDPFEAQEKQRRIVESERAWQLRAFLKLELNTMQREILCLLAREGLGSNEIGQRLGRKTSTIDNNLTAIRAAYNDFMQTHGDTRDATTSVLIADFARVVGDTNP